MLLQSRAVLWLITEIAPLFPALASCLINAKPLSGTPPAADNSLIGCTGHDLTDDWSLASTHFVDSHYKFGCVLLLNQIYLTTMYRLAVPLRCI